jgi:hypothetical protein
MMSLSANVFPNRRLVHPIFLGKFDHGFNVFGPGLIEPETAVNNEAAVFAHDIDQLPDAVFHLAGRAGKKR